MDGHGSLRAFVRGHVQGVNFRQFIVTRAQFLNLTGYVCNVADGNTVEMVAEGSRRDLHQLLEYLREGPHSARVDDVEVEWTEPTNQWTAFGVLT